MAGSFNASVRVIGKDIVDAKLLAAAPNILIHNRAMIQTMLDFIKPEVIAATPIGPGHFGYHLRGSYVTDVRSRGLKSTGVLKAPVQGYWREYGTKRGERAYMIAHHALAGVKKFITAYYGGMAKWWRT